MEKGINHFSPNVTGLKRWKVSAELEKREDTHETNSDVSRANEDSAVQ
jgi:hypothetical protein